MNVKYNVLGIVGMPGAGKTVSLDRLRLEKNAKIVTMGDRVREKVIESGQPVTPVTLGKMAADIRERYGPDAVARLTIDKIEDIARDGDLIIIIDGIRSMQEVRLFRERWALPIIGIHSPPKTRHARLKERKRQDDEITDEYLEMRDKRELGFGVGDVFALADAIVINDSKTTKEMLQNRMMETVSFVLQA